MNYHTSNNFYKKTSLNFLKTQIPNITNLIPSIIKKIKYN